MTYSVQTFPCNNGFNKISNYLFIYLSKYPSIKSKFRLIKKILHIKSDV